MERWHQTLQTDLPDDAGPFATIAAAQAAVDAWRQEYNTARPHQGPAVNGTGRRCVPVPVVTMCLTSTLCLLGERGPDQAALRKRSASAQWPCVKPWRKPAACRNCYVMGRDRFG